MGKGLRSNLKRYEDPRDSSPSFRECTLSMQEEGWGWRVLQIFKNYFVAQGMIELNISWPSCIFVKYFMVPPINFSFLFKAGLW